MSNLAIGAYRVISKEAGSVVSENLNAGIKIAKKATETFKQLSYSKNSGLRPMQHITERFERETIEAYRKELPHSIWGSPEKLKEWVSKKINELVNHNYSSSKLDKTTVETERNSAIKNWAEILNSNSVCQNNPFLKLKIIKSLTGDLTQSNAQLPPHINLKVLEDTIYEIKRTGANFKKTYLKLLRDFDSSVNVSTEEIYENGIRGKWFSLSVPTEAEASHSPGLFNRVKEYISVLSQRSNWCIRTPKVVGTNYSGSDFHIFIDSRGVPQICLVGSNKSGGWFRDLKGCDQYAPIKRQYKDILKSFLIRHKLDKATYGGINSDKVQLLDLTK